MLSILRCKEGVQPCGMELDELFDEKWEHSGILLIINCIIL